MLVYTLNSLLQYDEVVEKFESMIWTERFNRWGDFKLTTVSSMENRKLLTAGTRIAIPDSKRVMTVETVVDSTDEEGKKILTFSGRSLEEILDNRVAKGTLDSLVDEPKWILTGLPAAIARQMFHDICVTGILDPGDIILDVVEDSIFPEDTIPEPADSVTYEIEPKSLYTAMYELCDVYGMGFRLVRDPATRQLYFDVYMGSDRTTKQIDLPAVVFSPDLQTLQSTTKLSSTALYKNVAYVFSKVGSALVYPLDIDPENEGFERRALLVKVDDIEEDADPEDALESMIQRAREELAKNRRVAAFDGELVGDISGYETLYWLGDLVEIRDEDGTTSEMQVTEQIFVSDKEGDRAYPTLTLNTFITPGSWDGWPATEVWDDVDPDLDWDDLP
jgi:hypothetical protein